MRTVTSTYQAPSLQQHFVSSEAAVMLTVPVCARLPWLAQPFAALGLVMRLCLMRLATPSAKAAPQDNSISDPEPRSTSNVLVWLHSLVRARAMIALYCLSAVLVFLAGCSSTPKNLVLLKESPSRPEVFDPVATVFPVTPPISTEWQAVREEPVTAAAPFALKEPVTDLWDRVRRGFGIPNLDNGLVRKSAQWYASRPEYLQRMTARSQKYLFHVVEELERRNMPTELALLPFVESAFNPHAVSSAKAAGMWQFIPSTGKDFDLKQNAFRDDRRDVLASTRAALDYLQKLYGMFGDWQLALAAYNWGERSVGRSIARNQRAGLGTGYTDLTMPMETRSYVPKLQAIKNIVANPKAIGAQLLEIHNHPYFQSVTIARDIDVAVAARLAEITLDEFKALNPSANRPVILAAGTPQILLPWDNAAVFQHNLAAHRGHQLANWTAWVVPTTMSPAAAARKVGMTEAELRRANGIPPGKSIKAGSTLIVKRKPTVRADVSGPVADTAQLVLVKTPPPVQHRKTKATRSRVRKPSVPTPKHRSVSTA